jgi:hypothetical protein
LRGQSVCNAGKTQGLEFYFTFRLPHASANLLKLKHL